MKKLTYMILLLTLLITLGSCNTKGSEKGSPRVEGGTQHTVKEITKPKVKGVNDVDVLNSHEGIEGSERMQDFYDDIQNGVASDLRIVHYTIEGDPMVTDLTYNGESLEVKHDYTRDTYGNGEIVTNSCRTMIVEANPTNISYIAIDCSGVPYGMDNILQINYNVSQQDLFEVELKYGVELENEINTLTYTAKKEISATETQVMSDFDMSESVMQEVYKRLVFANYLAEKELKSTCEIEDAMNYHLKVHINGGNSEYRWTECDKSLDGVNLTELAEYIIEQSQKAQSEKPKVTVQGYVLELKDNTLLIGEELNMLDYEWLKDEIHQMDMDSFVFDFTNLEGVNTEEYKLGDKVHATIDGSVRGSKPGRAKVKEIKKIE